MASRVGAPPFRGSIAASHRCPSRTPLRCVADASAQLSRQAGLDKLGEAIGEVQRLPPSQRQDGRAEAAKSARGVLQALTDAKQIALYDSYTGRTMRRTIGLGDLKMLGMKNPESIGIPSVRNDAAFLAAVVGGSSILALALGQLPGQWGFWGQYLGGGISIAVLGVGSVAPGLLELPIRFFSNVFPDYRDRVARHEAAHFLCAYLLGVPVVNYSVDLGAEHTEFFELKLERKLFAGGAGGRLSEGEVDALAVIAMAGIAAEALAFEEVVGQNTDLYDLQKLFGRAAQPLSSNTQMSVTRWAVWQAAIMLRAHDAAFKALVAAMARGASVPECIGIIETASGA
jgi:hypothetical protein